MEWLFETENFRTFLESNSNADTGAQVALPPEEEEEEQVDPSLIAQGEYTSLEV